MMAEPEVVLDHVNRHVGSTYVLGQRLAGGEQNGAYLLLDQQGRTQAVLKWQEDPVKAAAMLRAKTAIDHVVDGGWSVAEWLHAGGLTKGGAYCVQAYASGRGVDRLARAEIDAVLRVNASQQGLAWPDADHDSSRMEAVLAGELPWRHDVTCYTSTGAALVQRIDRMLQQAGHTAIPGGDVVHGDYSPGNMLFDSSDMTLVDSETVRRGCRARDLADLYRSNAIYGFIEPGQVQRLHAAGVAVGGREVFLRCLAAVTIDNLAWWVANKTPAAFDTACARLATMMDCVEAPGPLPPL